MEYWNDGILEWWFKEDEIPLFNSRQEEFYNNPTFHFPRTQYSNIPIVSEANWLVEMLPVFFLTCSRVLYIRWKKIAGFFFYSGKISLYNIAKQFY